MNDSDWRREVRWPGAPECGPAPRTAEAGPAGWGAWAPKIRRQFAIIDLGLYQPLDGLVELADLLTSVTGLDRLGHAVLGVFGEEFEGHALESGPSGVDLSQDVDAV